MPKFRKKPVVIEAVQWHQHGDHKAVLTFGQWKEKHPDQYLGYAVADHAGLIHTLEGPHTVTPGDWIITGIKGEHYPCKPDIFDASYDEAVE